MTKEVKAAMALPGDTRRPGKRTAPMCRTSAERSSPSSSRSEVARWRKVVADAGIKLE